MAWREEEFVKLPIWVYNKKIQCVTKLFVWLCTTEMHFEPCFCTGHWNDLSVVSVTDRHQLAKAG